MIRRNCSVAVLEIKLITLMVICQIASGGVSIFYKVAVANGMKIKILVAYRLIFATIFITPLALVLERKSRPKLTWMVAFQGFLCGLFGAALGSSLYAESLVLTSATFASAMSNLTPALTLLLALIFRLERLEIHKSSGKAKLLGTVVGIGGAMVLTLYKGEKIMSFSTHINLVASKKSDEKPQVHKDPILGSLFIVGSCLSFAAWLILQKKMGQTYPTYSSTALTCFNGAIINGVYALCMEPHWKEWKLGWNIRLLSSAYLGIIGSGMVTAITAWGTHVRGPLYVSSFCPLGLIFVAVMASLFLEENLHVGSLIGSVIIIIGLYLVLWGKAKEMKTTQSSSKATVESVLEMNAFAGSNDIGSPQPANRRTEEMRSLAV